MPTLDFKGKSFVYAHHLSVPFRELVIDAQKSCPPPAGSSRGDEAQTSKGKKSEPPHVGGHPTLEGNLIIHGDNLHALKALLPVYAGKVDCIYIDPPYNTGNEGWCYNDNVRSPLMREWLKKSANPVEKEDLERHDKWLCMMWPRLQLLRELLAEDGAIFVSIDDEEVGRLLALMDEVFGEDHRIAVFTWVRKKKGSNLSQEFRKVTEYVVAYRKGSRRVDLHGAAAYAEKAVPLLNRSNSESELTFPAGKVAVGRGFKDGIVKPGKKGPEGELEVTLRDEVEVVDGRVQNEFRLKGRFRWSQDFMDDEFQKGSEFVLSVDFRVNVYRHDQGDKEKAPASLISPSDGVGTNEDATDELRMIFGNPTELPFDYPKPSSLVEFLLRAKTHREPNALILDSFAGSGTTAHAVLALNKKDGGNRKFILVETEAYADTLTAERVRRVIHGYKFVGTQREELMREPITLTALKKAGQLLEKADSFDLLDKHRFDRIAKSVEDGALVVTGERKVTEQTEGLGGSFTFATLGPELSLDTLLADGLPTFEALAKYVFFTATGRTLNELPGSSRREEAQTSSVKPATKAKKSEPPHVGDYDDLGFIGETDVYRVHLHYQPAKAWLQSNDAALTETMLDAMTAANTGRKRLLVFAAAKFMSQRELTRLGVEFCQLPYAIHRILGD
jgi:adenine-specific DNA-methyltransferase